MGGDGLLLAVDDEGQRGDPLPRLEARPADEQRRAGADRQLLRERCVEADVQGGCERIGRSRLAALVNYQRLYEYRFRGVDQKAREAVWREIGPFIHARLGSPDRVLDPAAGAASS